METPLVNKNIIMKNNTKTITKKQFIKLIDDKIQNMGVKKVYHPKRLKPKWNTLTTDKQRLVLFESYISKKEASIGFNKLVSVNLCHKTLEAILIENPDVVKFLSSENLLQHCIDKFNRYDNGINYLKEKQLVDND